jgi:hypothetical protein
MRPPGNKTGSAVVRLAPVLNNWRVAVRAKNPLPPRIEGAIAFPVAEMANGDDGLVDDQTQLAVQRVVALIANSEALLIMAGADQLMPCPHKVKAERRSRVNFTRLRAGTDRVRPPQRLHPARSSQ